MIIMVKKLIASLMASIVLSVSAPCVHAEVLAEEPVINMQTDDIAAQPDLLDPDEHDENTKIPEMVLPEEDVKDENGAETPDDAVTADEGDLPKKCNMYKKGRLTRVKDQNPYQSCWAFAIMGAMEADLISDGTRKTIDLSEAQLAYYVTNKYKDPEKCRRDTVSRNGSSRIWIDNGGRAYQGLHVLSDLVGAIKEKDAPYDKVEDFHPDKSYIISKDYARLDSASYISVSDRKAVKKAIMEHGGVIASYYDDSAKYYDKENNSYYSPVKDFNHTVMIVGWNDGFSKKKFKNTPKGNGAWLVRNSRGYNGYDHHGYFWMSYYDKGFKTSEEVIAVDADRKTYDNCYAYDGQPILDTIRYAKSGQAVTVTYKVAAPQSLKAVGFEIRTPKVDTKVTVTNKKTGESVKGKIYTKYAGFHTVRLERALKIYDKAEVEVSLKFKPRKDEKTAIVCEKPGSFTFGRGDYLYTGVCDKGFMIGNKKKDCDPRIKLYSNDIAR